MESVDPIAAFNAAYAAAQAECRNPDLDSINPAYRSKFSSLAATRNAVVPVFAKHGLAIQQTVVVEMLGDRPYAGVRTVLRHKDGHVEALDPPCLMPVQKHDAQGIASSVTYSKRQSLQALAGVTGELDDDANEAVGKPQAPERFDGARVTNAVKAARAALEADVEEAEKAKLVKDWHGKANKDTDFYQVVWAELGSKERAAIKIYLAQNAKPEMLANGRSAA